MKSGTKSKIFAAVGIIALLLSCAVCVYTIFNNKEVVDDSGDDFVSGEGIVVKDDNRNYAAEIKDKVEKGMIMVRMTQNWVFKDGCKTSNAYLANATGNRTDLRFQITLAETGEVIMTSPDVPVGSCIENFPLSVELDPGTYAIIIAHQQVEDGKVTNEVRTSGKITVK